SRPSFSRRFETYRWCSYRSPTRPGVVSSRNWRARSQCHRICEFRTLNGGKWLEKLKEIALNPEGAVAALTRAIAIDRVGDGIRCNAIAPGTIDTPYFDEVLKKSADLGATRKALAARQLLGRLGTPEEIAAGILFLASDESRFATDTILTLDGGMTAQ